MKLDTDIDETYAAERFAQMSDAQLVAVVTRDRDDYVERALELAHDELAKRGIDPPAAEERAASLPPKKPTGFGEAWMNLLPTVLLLSALGLPVTALVFGTPWKEVLLFEVPVSALQLAVGFGLRKRKVWAFYLHWLWLAARVAIFAVPKESLFAAGVALLAFAPHALYFATRRNAFK